MRSGRARTRAMSRPASQRPRPPGPRWPSGHLAMARLLPHTRMPGPGTTAGSTSFAGRAGAVTARCPGRTSLTAASSGPCTCSGPPPPRSVRTTRRHAAASSSPRAARKPLRYSRTVPDAGYGPWRSEAPTGRDPRALAARVSAPCQARTGGATDRHRRGYGPTERSSDRTRPRALARVSARCHGEHKRGATRGVPGGRPPGQHSVAGGSGGPPPWPTQRRGGSGGPPPGPTQPSGEFPGVVPPGQHRVMSVGKSPWAAVSCPDLHSADVQRHQGLRSALSRASQCLIQKGQPHAGHCARRRPVGRRR